MIKREGTIDDQYFEWLYSHIASVRNRNPSRSYWNLAKQLYRTAYRYFVPNDDNRAADGIALRYEFLGEVELDRETLDWLSLDCSFLEMLIGLSRRVSFHSYGTAVDWFWHFIKTLEIEHFTDELYEISVMEAVEEACQNVNLRTYAYDGTGGLFPLRDPQEDQRRIEIWYQMAAYILEGEYVDNGPRI